MKKRAFTLIELLIVVAIIAILAAIAVPNFLEAQTRSKVSRARADMRTSATAIEAYTVDYNSYIKSNYFSYAFAVISQSGPGYLQVLEKLTTPIAYLSSGASLKDPFVGRARYSSSNFPLGPPATLTTDPRDLEVSTLYHYMARDEYGTTTNGTEDDEIKAKWWVLESCGPDRCYNNLGGILTAIDNDPGTFNPDILCALYDPTNGTVSQGSVWRVGGECTGPVGTHFFHSSRGSQK
jgi:prepilin-type N-terminal cleavage/methylation domain-containing protein